MESPLQVDDPAAVFRVHCTVCRQNVWAGLDEPPGSGDDILGEHDCPGPVDITEDPGPGPTPLLEPQTRLEGEPRGPAPNVAPLADPGALPAGSTDTTIDMLPDVARHSGYPAEPSAPAEPPAD